MRNIFTIFSREFKSYFTTPIGYIFLVVFWLVSISLYIWPFFIYPSADMGRYFTLLPIVLCVFIPAVTMRLWAEERKLNTFEMLQTFPMSSTQVVLGKYFASLLFYLVALAGTAGVPVMLAYLGDPDGGVITACYIGAIFLGALYLALGLFFSGFCKDQIIAYVVSLLALLGLYLLGGNILGTILTTTVAAFLKDLLGVTEHYYEFTKGVIDPVHIIYFLVWTVLFLFLNGFYLESRHCTRAGLLFSGALVLSLAIGLVFNFLISTQSFGRMDLTEDGIYTLSEGTRRILSKLDVPVAATLYITPSEEMPTEIKDMEKDITAKLEELTVAAAGRNFKVDVVHLSTQKFLEEQRSELERQIAKMSGKEKEAAEDKVSKEKDIEKKLFDKGVMPFNVQVYREGGQAATQLVYCAMEITYKDHDPEIINRLVPDDLGRLEYEVISRIYRLTRDKKPVVAMIAPRFQLPQWQIQMLMQMGREVPPGRDLHGEIQKAIEAQHYEVKRIDLNAESKMPDAYDMLVVMPREELGARQLWEIDKALVEGKPVVLAAHSNVFEYTIDRDSGVAIKRTPMTSGLNKLLDKYGLGISDAVLMSTNAVELTIPVSHASNPNMQMIMNLKSPVNIMLTRENMNQANPITNRMEKVLYLFGAALTTDRDKLKENMLAATELFGTGPLAWLEDGAAFDASTRFDSKQPPLKLTAYPCALLVEGQFPDAYRGELRPAWEKHEEGPGMPPAPPAEEEPAQPLKPAPGKLVLVGSSLIFRDEVVQNIDDPRKLIVNILDSFAGAQDLIAVRQNEAIERLITKGNISDGQRRTWKFVNIAGFSIVTIAAGLVYLAIRRGGRREYQNAVNRRDA
ncbi:MAG: Gldg family protein [Planctomycetota bacterium]